MPTRLDGSMATDDGAGAGVVDADAHESEMQGVEYLIVAAVIVGVSGGAAIVYSVHRILRACRDDDSRCISS